MPRHAPRLQRPVSSIACSLRDDLTVGGEANLLEDAVRLFLDEVLLERKILELQALMNFMRMSQYAYAFGTQPAAFSPSLLPVSLFPPLPPPAS